MFSADMVKKLYSNVTECNYFAFFGKSLCSQIIYHACHKLFPKIQYNTAAQKLAI